MLPNVAPAGLSGVTIGARVLVFLLGTLLLGWTIGQLRRRVLLIPLGALFVSISAFLILFAFFPSVFDGISHAVGVWYPPIFYLILTVIALMLVVLRLASRLSIVDQRCRRLAQELAIRETTNRGPVQPHGAD
jgi:hypothetical protein